MENLRKAFVEELRERSGLTTLLISKIGLITSLILPVLILLFLGFVPLVNHVLYVAAFFAMIFLLLKLNIGIAARLFLSSTLPIIILFISIYNKILAKVNPELMNPINYFDARYLLFITLVVPLVVLNIKERAVFFLGITIPICAVIFFDPIHEFFDVGYFQMGMRSDDYYFSANLYTVVAMSFIFGALIIMKYRSEIAEEWVFRRNFMTSFYYDNIIKFANLISIKDGNIENTYQKACQIISEALSVSRVSIWNFDERKSLLICQCLFQEGKFNEADPVLYKNQFKGYFNNLLTNKSFTVHQIDEDIPFQNLKNNYLIPHKIKSKLDSVIRVEGNEIGVIFVEDSFEKRNWDNEEMIFLRSISDLISSSFEFKKMITLQNQLSKVNKQIDELNTGLEQKIKQNTLQLELKNTALSSFASKHVKEFNSQMAMLKSKVDQIDESNTENNNQVISEISEVILNLDLITKRQNESITEFEDK